MSMNCAVTRSAVGSGWGGKGDSYHGCSPQGIGVGWSGENSFVSPKERDKTCLKCDLKVFEKNT